MGFYASPARLWVVGLALLLAPCSTAAQCTSVGGDGSQRIHLRCSAGPEFKIVPATSREPAAAKIRLPGPFDTAEFTAAYIRPGEVVKLVGARPGRNNVGQPEQVLYAFLNGPRVYWIAAARAPSRGGPELDVVHNLDGIVRAERIRGDLELPVPRGLTLIEQRVVVAAPEEAYRRLGL